MLTRLTTTEGHGEGNVLDLSGLDVVTIGRGPDSTIQVKDPDASRNHCKIERVGDHWLVADVKSRNGTLVNDKQVEIATLKSGDCVCVGRTQFLFEVLPDEAPAPAAPAPAAPPPDAPPVTTPSGPAAGAGSTTAEAESAPKATPAPAEPLRFSWCNPLVLFVASFALTVGVGAGVIAVKRAKASAPGKANQQGGQDDLLSGVPAAHAPKPNQKQREAEAKLQYNKADKIWRTDANGTAKAKVIFEGIITNFPDTKAADDARGQLRKIKDLLVE